MKNANERLKTAVLILDLALAGIKLYRLVKREAPSKKAPKVATTKIASLPSYPVRTRNRPHVVRPLKLDADRAEQHREVMRGWSEL